MLITHISHQVKFTFNSRVDLVPQWFAFIFENKPKVCLQSELMNTIGIIVFQNHYKYIMDSFTHKKSNYHFDKIIVDKVLQKFTNNSSIFLLYQVEWVKEILILLISNFHKNKPKVRGTFFIINNTAY